MKALLYITVFVLYASNARAATYYLSPDTGDLSNAGTMNAPWPGLQEVLDAGYISTQEYIGLPFDSLTSTLVTKNTNGVVQPGDTLILLSGYYGHVEIDRHYNEDYITVMSAPSRSPILASMHIRSCAKWRIIGLTIDASIDYEAAASRLIFVESHGFRGPSADVYIADCYLTSGPDGWDWTAEEWLARSRSGIYTTADRTKVDNNILENVDHAISLVANRCQAVDNRVINFSGDGLRVLGSHLRVEGNTIKNCFKVDDNHDDALQSFTVDAAPSYDTIRSNIIINHEELSHPLAGPLQGIGCFDGPYHHWLVENNVISVNHWHGITFLGGYDCQIVNNTVLDPTPEIEPGASWIRIADHKDGTPSANCSVINNVANKFVVDAATSNNIVLDDTDAYNQEFVDWLLYDFSLQPTSQLVDAGATQGPAIDIVGTTRPQGAANDIGAYEYAVSTASTSDQGNVSLSMHPNPTTLHIEILTTETLQSILLTDSQSKRISPMIVRTSTGYHIDLQGYPPGIYTISYTSQTGSLNSRLIVLL